MQIYEALTLALREARHDSHGVYGEMSDDHWEYGRWHWRRICRVGPI